MSGQGSRLRLSVLLCVALLAGPGSLPAAAAIIDGLIGNWTFDSSGALGDDSYGTNDGTAYAGVSYATGGGMGTFWTVEVAHP